MMEITQIDSHTEMGLSLSAILVEFWGTLSSQC